MGRPPLAEQRKRKEQFRLDRDRIKFGSLGAASEVRKIDVTSVETAALIARLEPQPLLPSVARARFYFRRGKILSR
jgi:hypothetical protein